MTHTTDCEVVADAESKVADIAERFWESNSHVQRNEIRKEVEEELGWNHLGGGAGRTVFEVPSEAQVGPEDSVTREAPCVIKFATPHRSFDGKSQNNSEIRQFEEFPEELVTEGEGGVPVAVPIKDWDEDEYLWLSMPKVEQGGSAREVNQRLAQHGWDCNDLHGDNIGTMHGHSVVLDYGLECTGGKKLVEDLADDIASALGGKGARNIDIEGDGVGGADVLFDPPEDLLRGTTNRPGDGSVVSVDEIGDVTLMQFTFGGYDTEWAGELDPPLSEAAELVADEIDDSWFGMRVFPMVFDGGDHDDLHVEFEVEPNRGPDINEFVVTDLYTDFTSEVRKHFPGGEVYPHPEEVDRIEEADADDVKDHLTAHADNVVLFWIPKNYDNEGVGVARSVPEGESVLYEAPGGEQYWATPEVVADNAIQFVGEGDVAEKFPYGGAREIEGAPPDYVPTVGAVLNHPDFDDPITVVDVDDKGNVMVENEDGWQFNLRSPDYADPAPAMVVDHNPLVGSNFGFGRETVETGQRRLTTGLLNEVRPGEVVVGDEYYHDRVAAGVDDAGSAAYGWVEVVDDPIQVQDFTGQPWMVEVDTGRGFHDSVRVDALFRSETATDIQAAIEGAIEEANPDDMSEAADVISEEIDDHLAETTSTSSGGGGQPRDLTKPEAPLTPDDLAELGDGTAIAYETVLQGGLTRFGEVEQNSVVGWIIRRSDGDVDVADNVATVLAVGRRAELAREQDEEMGAIDLQLDVAGQDD